MSDITCFLDASPAIFVYSQRSPRAHLISPSLLKHAAVQLTLRPFAKMLAPKPPRQVVPKKKIQILWEHRHRPQNWLSRVDDPLASFSSKISFSPRCQLSSDASRTARIDTDTNRHVKDRSCSRNAPAYRSVTVGLAPQH